MSKLDKILILMIIGIAVFVALDTWITMKYH